MFILMLLPISLLAQEKGQHTTLLRKKQVTVTLKTEERYMKVDCDSVEFESDSILKYCVTCYKSIVLYTGVKSVVNIKLPLNNLVSIKRKED